jgi:hypothetical protein
LAGGGASRAGLAPAGDINLDDVERILVTLDR